MPYRMNAVATTGMGGADRRPNRETGVLRQTDVKRRASSMLTCDMAGHRGQISVVGSSRNWYSQCPTSRWTRPFSASFRISSRPLALGCTGGRGRAFRVIARIFHPITRLGPRLARHRRELRPRPHQRGIHRHGRRTRHHCHRCSRGEPARSCPRRTGTGTNRRGRTMPGF